jgi:hypothetical protein
MLKYMSQLQARGMHSACAWTIADYMHMREACLSARWARVGKHRKTLQVRVRLQRIESGSSVAAYQANVQKGYASTIYPDPPASDTSVYPTQRDYEYCSFSSSR